MADFASSIAEIVLTTDSIPCSLMAASARSDWILELDSLEQYITATFFASGISCLPSAICCATGFISDVPVRFAPGASLEAIRPEPAGSVTAVKRTGISEVFSLIADAQGVATARIRSEFSLISVSAMLGQFAASAAADNWWMTMFSSST